MAATNKEKTKTRNLATSGLTRLVRGYQIAISPLLPPRCRFHPSCSNYVIEALEKHGAVTGTMLSVRRISKCHPFHAGGIDEVPCLKHK